MLRPLMVGSSAVPLGQGETIRRSRVAAPVLALTAGFTFSAILTVGLIALAGTAFGVGLLPEDVRVLIGLVVCLAMLGLDVTSIQRRTMCPVSPRRQAFKNTVFQYGESTGAMLWGIDTGLAVTTFRVSGATWAMLALSFLGVSYWWAGLGYAAGFCVSIAIAILGPRWTSSEREASRVPQALMRHQRVGQLTCALALGLVTVLLLLWLTK